MVVYRLSKRKYSRQLNGKGASKFNNRWNSKGTEMIYTSESRALALAEVSVHLSISALPGDYVMIEIDIPDRLSLMTINENELGENWNGFPHSTETMKIGDSFIDKQESLSLRVPSAVVKGDHNILINPHQKEFKSVKIKCVSDFPIDERLFKNDH